MRNGQRRKQLLLQGHSNVERHFNTHKKYILYVCVRIKKTLLSVSVEEQLFGSMYRQIKSTSSTLIRNVKLWGDLGQVDYPKMMKLNR